MASVVIAGDTSGTCTLQAANAAGTTVLNLPTTSGTLVSTGDSPSFVTVNATNVIASANSNAATFNGTTVNATTGNITTVTAGLGNATAPAYSFTGDTNTGIFSPTADTIAFTEGGSERMRITSDGKVGIGTTNPSGDFTVSNGGANGFEINPTEGSGASNKVNSYNRSTSAYTTLQFDALDFRVATGSSATERMRIASDGTISTTIGSTLYGAYPARAWVNFNGTGTVAIRTSRNVSSITDNGTGDYTINFTQAMPDNEYVVLAGAGEGLDSARIINSSARVAPTTSAARVKVQSAGGSDTDAVYTYAAIFR